MATTRHAPPRRSGAIVFAVNRQSTAQHLWCALLLFSFFASTLSFAQSPRWTADRANAWYAAQPWRVGSNYIPATAINQLEMWQAATFDPKRIDLELGWAESLGLNTMRVFLHDLLWQQDPEGFKSRLNTFLAIANKHHIKILFVLFDSCWDPNPHLGKQREPRPGIHNSGWVQSPGTSSLQDPTQLPRLEGYVKGVVGAFARDQRILGWDVWNEPDNTNDGSYALAEPPNKVALVDALLPKVFAWAREAGATQPLTSGVWQGDWSVPEKLNATQRIQLELSDVISFHNYDDPQSFETHLRGLLPYHRPILCTEYMARGNGSTFEGTLPIARKYRVAAYNWGFAAGKTQTYLPWDSWKNPYVDRQPEIWFHEILRTDGQPYSQKEVDFIRAILKPGANP